jgi:hypothetical protein
MVLAGEERPEEAAARLELAAAVGAALVDDGAEVVRSAMSAPNCTFLSDLSNGSQKSLRTARQPSSPLFDLVQLHLHAGGEVDVEDLGELLDHHLLHRLTELGGEETALLEVHVAAVGEHADDAGVRRRPADAEPLQLLDEDSPRRSAAAAR